MIGSLRNLLGVNLGFNPEKVITMRLSLPEARYSIARTTAFYHQLQDRVRGLPGVEALAIVNHRIASCQSRSDLRSEGRVATQVHPCETLILDADLVKLILHRRGTRRARIHNGSVGIAPTLPRYNGWC